MEASTPDDPTYELDAPGVLRVHYRDAKQMAPMRQRAIVDAILAQAQHGPVGLLFEIDPAVRLISPSVSAFWITVTASEQHRLCAISVVAQSVAVRAAASGFGVANSLRGTQLQLRAHAELDAGAAWVRARVASLRAPAA